MRAVGWQGLLDSFSKDLAFPKKHKMKNMSSNDNNVQALPLSLPRIFFPDAPIYGCVYN